MSGSRFVTPIVHPSSILQGRYALEPAQIAYLKRLSANPAPQLVDISKPPPGCNPTPSLEELRLFTEQVRGFYQLCTFDVENAGPHLVCCGVVAMYPDTLAPGPGCCFRFRRKGGEPWWPTFDAHLEAVTMLDSILGDPTVTKVGHFSTQHDLPLLLGLGFKVRGRLLDTAVLLHATHSELPKGLQFSATLFCGAPRWKDVPDEKDAAEPEGDEEAA